MVRVNFLGKEILSCEAVNHQRIVQKVCFATSLEPNEFYLLQNGRILTDRPVQDANAVYVEMRVLGGHGPPCRMFTALLAQHRANKAAQKKKLDDAMEEVDKPDLKRKARTLFEVQNKRAAPCVGICYDVPER